MMKPSQLKIVLSEIILKTEITPLVWGSRGIGKSQICSSLTSYLEKITEKPWGLVDLRISTQEISDLTGIPRPWSWKALNKKTGKEAVITETEWSVPSWFPTAEKIAQPDRGLPENGIIFLDEINRGGHQETQAIFQFVLDRRIHTHQLAPGWKIIAAANPPTEEYLVNEFDSALLDRFIHLHLKSDAEDWLSWANSEEGRIDQAVIRFIDTYPEMLYELSDEEKDWTPVIKSSPRSWEGVNTLLQNCQFPPSVAVEIFAGLVGQIRAVTFWEYMNKEYYKPIKAYELMENYQLCRERLLEILAAHRMDQINIIMQDLIELCRKTPDKFRVESFYHFFLDLPDDMKVTLIHSLIDQAQIYQQMNEHGGLLTEIGRIIRELNDEREVVTLPC